MKVPYAVVDRSSLRSRPEQTKLNPLRSIFWQQWLQQLFDWLLVHEQLKVTETFDCVGNVYYQIHNLETGKVKTFDSADEAIAWLERERH